MKRRNRTEKQSRWDRSYYGMVFTGVKILLVLLSLATAMTVFCFVYALLCKTGTLTAEDTGRAFALSSRHGRLHPGGRMGASGKGNFRDAALAGIREPDRIPTALFLQSIRSGRNFCRDPAAVFGRYFPEGMFAAAGIRRDTVRERICRLFCDWTG